jgi:uncharacterized protein (TIGR03083 family)
MRIEDHIAALRIEGNLFTSVLRRADLDAVVPTCPEWTVRELARHTGRVHRWAASYARDARPDMMTADEEEHAWGAMPEDAALVDWFRDGHARLVDALATAPRDLACWSFLPAPSPLAFWARRQAHETTIHRVDAELAGPGPSAVPLEFAVDGLDELLLCFFSRRRNRLRFDDPKTLVIVATDAGASWLVRIGPEGASAQRRDGSPPNADATVAGPASALYLGLWNRGPLAEADAEARARAEADAEARARAEADAGARPESDAYAGLEAAAGAEAEPGAGAEPGAEPGSEADAGARAEAGHAGIVVTGDAGLIDVWRQKARITWA